MDPIVDPTTIRIVLFGEATRHAALFNTMRVRCSDADKMATVRSAENGT